MNLTVNDVDRIIGWLSFMTDTLGDWAPEDEDLHHRLIAWVDETLWLETL